MSGNRKALKIVSLIQFVLAAAVMILAALSKIGAAEAVNSEDWGAAARMYLELPCFAVFGFCSIFAAVTGVHGANRPSRLGSHRLLCILGILFGMVAMVVSGAGEGVPLVPALTVVVDLVGAVIDGRVRNELDDRVQS